MKTQPVRPKSGIAPHPLWVRLLAVFCMALLGVVSTAQASHAHDDPGQPSLRPVLHAKAPAAVQSASSDSSDSTVLCPLCVAMHSALPATHTLSQVAALPVLASVLRIDTAPRLFLWRSDLASRPPPAASPLA